MNCKCPHCGVEINPAKILRSIPSVKRSKQSKINGAKGGRPPTKTTGKKTHRVKFLEPISAEKDDPIFSQGWIIGSGHGFKKSTKTGQNTSKTTRQQ
jgi:hypothetical protein